MMFIIIQHLFGGIGYSQIRLPVHKAIDKEISWILDQSTKDIKKNK